MDISVNTKQQTLSSLAFPMEKDALRAFEDFLRQGVNYIQLSIGNYLLVHEIGKKKKHDAKCNLCLNEGLLLFFLKHLF